jgi:3-deoxy-7-phosphoheptulonate synthase
MVITIRAGVAPSGVDDIRERLERGGIRTQLVRRGGHDIIGCLGESGDVDREEWRNHPDVQSVFDWSRPYRLASHDTTGTQGTTPVRIGSARDAVVGGNAIVVIAGPCSIEGLELLRTTAHGVRDAGAAALRGGAFKPRTSPYSFQGLGAEALTLLACVRRETGLPIVTEVTDPRHVDLVTEHADVLQIGARNMQNYALLAEVGRVGRPVLLKRGFAATITEFLLAAEHIIAHGNTEVILCERGMRTFENATRFTLDISAIPVLKRETHLPVIVDPSHAAGEATLVPALAWAAVAAGADGLIVEVHAQPELSRSDRDQALSLSAFGALMRSTAAFARAAGRSVAGAPTPQSAFRSAPEEHAEAVR